MHSCSSRAALALILGASSLLLASCSEHDNDFVDSSPSSILISSEHSGFTGTEVYDWETPATVVRVEFRVRGFHNGNSRVRIFDALGEPVLDEIFLFPDDVFVIGGGGEFVDILFSDAGEPGRWTIRLDFDEFWGHLYLTLEDNVSLPPAESP